LFFPEHLIFSSVWFVMLLFRLWLICLNMLRVFWGLLLSLEIKWHAFTFLQICRWWNGKAYKTKAGNYCKRKIQPLMSIMSIRENNLCLFYSKGNWYSRFVMALQSFDIIITFQIFTYSLFFITLLFHSVFSNLYSWKSSLNIIRINQCLYNVLVSIWWQLSITIPPKPHIHTL
jgi:hypothetical protein